MKYLHFAIAWLAFILSGPEIQAQEAEDTVQANYTYTVISKGALPFADGDYLFSNELDYVAFWAGVLGPLAPVPGIIYDDETILMMVRTFPDGSESLRLSRIVETKDNLYVILKKTKARYFDEALHHWGLIVKFKKTKKPVSILYQVIIQ